MAETVEMCACMIFICTSRKIFKLQTIVIMYWLTVSKVFLNMLKPQLQQIIRKCMIYKSQNIQVLMHGYNNFVLLNIVLMSIKLSLVSQSKLLQSITLWTSMVSKARKAGLLICNTIAIKFCIAASRPFTICTLLVYAYNNLLKSINMTKVYFVLEHQHYVIMPDPSFQKLLYALCNWQHMQP